MDFTTELLESGIEMKSLERKAHYVVCIRNENYSASLELPKIYRALPDPEAMRQFLLRVIDESDEDYS